MLICCVVVSFGSLTHNEQALLSVLEIELLTFKTKDYMSAKEDMPWSDEAKKLKMGQQPSIITNADVKKSSQNSNNAHVGGSLPPLDDEIAAEPIQNALYATGKFTTDDCSTLADGILQYIKDAKMSIVGGNDR